MATSLQSTFYKDLHAGKYHFPEGLYSSVITAIEMRKEKEIRIHPQERPTQLERLKDKFGLKGIDFERVHIGWNSECKNFDYTVIIKPKTFLSNLSMFYDFSMDKVSDKNAGKVADSLVMKEKLKDLKDELTVKTPKKKKPEKVEEEKPASTEDEDLISDEKVIKETTDESSDLGKELKTIIENIVKVE